MRNRDPQLPPKSYDWGDRVELGTRRGNAAAVAALVGAQSVRSQHVAVGVDRDRNAGRTNYFVAISGYDDGRHFREARERHGPFRLAILPIGAYEPRWFMRDQHMNPAESVQALIDCGEEFALATTSARFN